MSRDPRTEKTTVVADSPFRDEGGGPVIGLMVNLCATVLFLNSGTCIFFEVVEVTLGTPEAATSCVVGGTAEVLGEAGLAKVVDEFS